MKKKESSIYRKVLIFTFLALIIIVMIVAVVVFWQTTGYKVIGKAVVSINGYTDSIYFTDIYLSGDYYVFISYDGKEVRCHCDNVVIYYDDNKE